MDHLPRETPLASLRHHRKKTSRAIHRLVLEAWVGPCPEGLICCHENGLPWDNRVENLRWDTPQANADDALRHDIRARGSRCNSKLTEAGVLEICRLRAEGVPVGDVATRFGVTPENIKAIVCRRTWRHLPDVHGGKGLAVFEGREARPGAAA